MKKKVMIMSVLSLLVASSVYARVTAQETYTSSCGTTWNISVNVSTAYFVQAALSSMESKCDAACGTNATTITTPSVW